MTANSLTVACVQHTGSADRQVAWQHSARAIENAAQQGAKLVLLQELHAGLYFCQSEDSAVFSQAETIPGETTHYFSELARKHDVVIVTSIFERRAPGLHHNTSVVIDSNGEIAGTYRKMHIPDDPGFYEKYYFAPGDLGFSPIQTSIGKLGVLVCWDQWYPEAARLMALAGAELLLYPTAIGWGTQDSDRSERQRQLDAWITVQRSHAIANGIPVLVSNRVGFEANPEKTQLGIEFWGNSFICGPQGEFLALAEHQNPDVLIADVDLSATHRVRCNWPFLRDRRIDFYHGLTHRFLDKTP